MESRGYSSGREYAAAPPLWAPEPARAVWRILAGKDDEDSTFYKANLNSFALHISERGSACYHLTFKRKGGWNETLSTTGTSICRNAR